MITMRIYSQRTVDLNGMQTKTGEDALPFVNEAGMFVADGMGGSAGVPVTTVPEELFDPDKLTEIIFSLYSDGDCDIDKTVLADYIKENFSSLSNDTMKRIYQSLPGNLMRAKKSGYFGSHALGVVMTLCLLMATQFDKNKPLDVWEKDIRSLKDQIVPAYKTLIEKLGVVCAQTSLNKIEYFGTTLSAAFYRENSDTVDVIFLNCGDSRNYVFDLDGFRQAGEDQGRNGGMTNRISMSEGAPVEISFERKQYRKPCAFFCMTDGIYSVFCGKNGFSSSPLYMEGFFMRTMENANSIEEVRNKLTAVFDARGNIDDSNSMAFAAFGFDTYDDLKKTAAERTQYLNKEYSLDDIPDTFFSEDYHKYVVALQKTSAGQIQPYLEQAYSAPEIQTYCRQQLMPGQPGAKYRKEETIIREQINNAKSQNSRIVGELRQIVRENYIDFFGIDSEEVKTQLAGFKNRPTRSAIYAASDAAKKYYSEWTNRRDALSRLIESVRQTYEHVQTSSGGLVVELVIPWTREMEDTTASWTNDTAGKLDESIDRWKNYLDDIKNRSVELTKALNVWNTTNEKTFKKTSLTDGPFAAPEDIVKEWLDNPALEREIHDTSIPFVRQEIIDRVKACRENNQKISKLEGDAEAALKRGAKQYWDENAAANIDILLRNSSLWASNRELAEKIQKELDNNAELLKYQRLDSCQQDVFSRYLSKHLSEVSEDKRADVQKNGWL